MLTLSGHALSQECECAKEIVDVENIATEIDYEKVPAFKKAEPYYSQEHRLNRAYLDSSNSDLEDFFKGWELQSYPNSKKILKEFPEVIRFAYEIFGDFYDPKDLKRIGKPEWGVDQFKNVGYLVVQGDLDVSIASKLSTDSFSRNQSSILDFTINEFRPSIKGSTPTLFLTEDYQKVLNRFLGDESVPLGHDGIMNPARAKGESEKRQKFLNNKLKIYHGHWGGWRLITDPTVTQIAFNKSLTKAVVHFSLVYEGGHAIYKHKKGKWVLVESKLTWIT